MISLYNLTEVMNLARHIAMHARRGGVIALYGPIGAGKTTFAKYLISALTELEVDQISSPTFNLVHLYKCLSFDIYHYDLYRLQTIEEVLNLGIEEAFSLGFCVVEWPEIIEHILPYNTIRCFMEYTHQLEVRKIIIK